MSRRAIATTPVGPARSTSSKPISVDQSQEVTMQPHKIVSRAEWLTARKAHLSKEKEFTRIRDALSRERRELPWVKVEKAYAFEGPQGPCTLADLFGDRSQLIVYHFMFG